MSSRSTTGRATKTTSENPLARFLTVHTQAELLMQEYRVSYEFKKSLPLAAIDVETSLHNQARIEGKLRHDLVERYTDLLRNGRELPPLIVWDATGNRKGGMLVIDGNHRRAAAQRAGLDAYPAFMVAHDTDPRTVTAMTMAANAVHGAVSTHEDLIAHALWQIDGGLPINEAARKFGLKPADVRKAAGLREAARRAARCGIDSQGWDKLPHTSRVRLCNLITDEAFAGAANLAITAGLSAAAIDDMTAELNRTKSVRTQEKILENLAETYRDQVGLRRAGDTTGRKGLARNTAKQRWMLALGQVDALPPIDEAITSLAPPERQSLAERVEARIKRLEEALGVLRQGGGNQAAGK